MGHNSYCWEWMRSFPMLMPIIMIGGCALIFYIIYVKFFKQATLENSGRPYSADVKDEESALEVLKKRYAKGEITKEEFESMKKDLT